MTLIYGIQTQLGVYLAADLRLTVTNGIDGQTKFEDDFCKYMTIGKHMHLAAAGDAKFASYLIKKLLASELANLPFTQFKKEIEAFIKAEAGFYPDLLKDGKLRAKPVAFIFAGVDPEKKVKMSMDKMIEKIQLMQGDKKHAIPVYLGKPLVDAMFKASTEQKQGTELEINQPLVSLFALEIIPSSGGIETRLTEGEWGTYIMYGPKGLRAEHAPPELAIKLDLAQRPKGETGEDMAFRHSHELILFFRKIISELGLETVGGSILTLLVTESGAYVLSGEMIAIRKRDGAPLGIVNTIIEQDGHFCTKVDGKITRMRSLLNMDATNDQTDLSI